MSLTPEAMKHIEAMAKAGDIVDAPNAEFDAVFVPKDMEMQSTEHLQKYKNRFAGQFRTDSIDSFAEYVNKQTTKTCFVSSEEPVANAIFDLGTVEQPEHCVHRAVIELNKTAAYRSLMNFCRADNRLGRIDQIGLAEFMEDWSFCVTAKDDAGKSMDINKAILAVRKITIDASVKNESEVRTFSTSKSINEEIEASSQGDPLPAWITFKCTPFFGLSEYEFPMRVCASVSRGEISFNMKVQNLEHIVEDMIAEFRELVTDAITDGTEIYTGHFSTGRLG